MVGPPSLNHRPVAATCCGIEGFGQHLLLNVRFRPIHTPTRSQVVDASKYLSIEWLPQVSHRSSCIKYGANSSGMTSPMVPRRAPTKSKKNT